MDMRARGGSWLPMMLQALLLAGCASPGQIAQQVVRSNLAQEQAHNQLLLLNVVRAYQRMPMHFSQVTAVRMPAGIGNPTFTLPTPFGPDFRDQIYNVSTQLAIQQGADVGVLNSQEFMRGITTPVPPSVMLYYLDQGWPQQMVLRLFVRSIEVYGDGKLEKEYVNYPENTLKYGEFRNELQSLLGCEIKAAPGQGRPYGPAFVWGQMDINGLAAAKAADLDLVSTSSNAPPGTYQFVRPSRSVELRLHCDDEVASDSVFRAPRVSLASEAPASSGREVNLVLRSPEAMIYHLGELARVQIEGVRTETGWKPMPTGYLHFRYSKVRIDALGVNDATLFRLNRNATSDAAVSVEYSGGVYSVDKGSPDDRSMHVLSLVTQILGIQNKGIDLPATATVRLIQ